MDAQTPLNAREVENASAVGRRKWASSIETIQVTGVGGSSAHVHEVKTSMSQLRKFLNAAFNPRSSNPGELNVDAIITLVGLAVWVICTLGASFGFATIPPQVSDIGSMIFGIGMGRASKNG